MWYVIWVRTGHEEEFKTWMDIRVPKGIYDRCFIPVKAEQRKIKGRSEEVLKKLFPGYIFTETENALELNKGLKRVPFVHRLLKTGEYFVPISETEEELIRKLTGEDGCAGMSVGIIENGRLKVVSGPITGFEQYVVKIDRHKRKAFLEMKLFNEIRHFTLGLEVVEKS